MADNRCSFGSLVRRAARILEKAGIEQASHDAWLLLEYVTGFDRTAYLLHMEDPADEQTAAAYLELAARRAERIPLQHLTGGQFFDGLLIRVNKDVLIPRQETECLVREAGRFLEGLGGRPGMKAAGIRVLDLCTGSGCIALALKARFPDIVCEAADISENALRVARDNAASLGLDVRFSQGNLFEPFDPLTDQFALIVSNPPYISTQEIGTLQPEVRLHDPLLALDGGADGLVFYRRIASDAGAFLKGGGCLMLETGAGQADEVSALLEENGFRNMEIHKDLAGFDRVVTAIYAG